MIDDNNVDVIDSPASLTNSIRNDKHNLSSTNEQIRDLNLKLKDFSASISSSSISNESGIDFPSVLPEVNLKKIQIYSTKEIYQQQSAILELLVTEQNFLKQIQFIVQVYVLGFERVRQEFFSKISLDEIFSNLKDVFRVSLDFWKHCMQPVVDNYEITKTLFKPLLLKNGFIKIGEILEPYIFYCTEISKCRLSISSLEKSNDLFAEYMKWAMNLEDSNREVLCDHLAKPFLRLTKYKILLQAIQKYSDPIEKTEMQEMIDSVDAFVSRVNEKIEETSLIKTLQYLNSHIDSYDVVEPVGDDMMSIINQYSKFDLTIPIQLGRARLIRQSLHQGSMKMREGSSKTVDIKLFLFTDVLLVTKYKKKTLGKVKIIKPPIMLNTVVVKKQSNNSFICICLNEFNCISSLHHFSSGDQKSIDKWIQVLDEAVRFYSTLKSTQTYSPMSFDISETIPTLKVVHSSPKLEKGKFKSSSNSGSIENDLQNEFSFKRKAPVTKKHKIKKDLSILKSKSDSVTMPQRKGSNPIVKPMSSSFQEKSARLYKSNSFAKETGKNKSVKHVSDCSDIDEPFDTFRMRSLENSPFESIKNNDININFEQTSNEKQSDTDLQIIDTRKVVGDAKSEISTRYRSDSSSSIIRILDKKLSISLNTLNI